MKSIMIVEDDEDIRDILQTILHDEGYGVSSFESLSSASAWLGSADKNPDLILLDFMFPSGNSQGFVDELKQKIPVILMSAANMAMRETAIEKVDGFVSKPIEIPNLLDTIERTFVHG